jgi:hypothetical protein
VQGNWSDINIVELLSAAQPDDLSLIRVHFEAMRTHPFVNGFYAALQAFHSSSGIGCTAVYIKLQVICIAVNADSERAS